MQIHLAAHRSGSSGPRPLSRRFCPRSLFHSSGKVGHEHSRSARQCSGAHTALSMMLKLVWMDAAPRRHAPGGQARAMARAQFPRRAGPPYGSPCAALVLRGLGRRIRAFFHKGADVLPQVFSGQLGADPQDVFALALFVERVQGRPVQDQAADAELAAAVVLAGLARHRVAQVVVGRFR